MSKKKCFSNTFLADLPGLDCEVLHFVVEAGDCILMPAMWIHFVYTPVDSVVFGVNYISGYDLPRFAISYEQEVRGLIDSFTTTMNGGYTMGDTFSVDMVP